MGGQCDASLRDQEMSFVQILPLCATVPQLISLYRKVFSLAFIVAGSVLVTATVLQNYLITTTALSHEPYHCGTMGMSFSEKR